MKSFKLLSITVLVLALGLALMAAEEKQPLTLERIFDPALRGATSTPWHCWLPDGTALLYDNRVSAEARCFERLDPATLERRPAVDREAAQKSLAALALSPEEQLPKSFPGPGDGEPCAGRIVYTLNDDIFTLDLAHSRFERWTRTPAAAANARLSPDGSRVAFVRDNNLFVVELPSGREKALTKDGRPGLLNGTLSWVYWEEIFGREDLAFWWSPDSRSILFLKTDESMVDLSFFPDYEPATPSVYKQRYPKAGGKNPVVRPWLAELPSGKLRPVKLGDESFEYILRVVWLPDGRQVSVQTLNRAQNKLQIWVADRSNGRSRAVFEETVPTYINVHDDLYFVRGGKEFVWASERDGYNHLYLYGIDGRLIRQLTSGPMMVRSSGGVAWVRGGVSAIDERGGWVYFTATAGLPLAPQLYRCSLNGGPVERISREDGTHSVTLSSDGRFYLDRYSRVDQLTGLYLHTIDGTRKGVITPPATEALADLNLVYPELTTYPADDGTRLAAQVLKPATLEPGRKYPVIVYVYGGPGAPVVWNRWGRDLLANNLLLQHGYACVSLDNRSASGLSKTFEETAYRKMFSGGEVEDILAGVRWLQSQPWVDPDRIGVWGWSGGGTFTLQLMTHSKAFKAGIAVAAVTDFRYYDTKFTECIMGRPEENPDGYKSGAPATFAKDLSGQLLLVHGVVDDNVHPQNAWRYIDELIAAGIQFEMLFYPRQDHGIGAPASRLHLYTAMLDFWRRKL